MMQNKNKLKPKQQACFEDMRCRYEVLKMYTKVQYKVFLPLRIREVIEELPGAAKNWGDV